jgi:hypothetical protein
MRSCHVHELAGCGQRAERLGFEFSNEVLNFDKLNTGFTVTPASASTIHGIALTSANERR